MPLRLIALLLTVSLTYTLADPHVARRWTGKNGKTFEGAYMGVDKTTGKYNFVLGSGKSYLIDPNNLSEDDLEWLDLALNPEKSADKTKGDWANFQADPEMDRTTLPVIDQADYGSKASDCVPSSFCNFLLWWDQLSYLPIDKSGDFDRKAEYIHSRMARYFRTRNNSGTSGDDAQEGMRSYFAKDLEELATARILVDYDCSVENLKQYAVGANATLLEVSTYNGNDYRGSHLVALSHVDPNDDIIFITWGARLRGRLKILEKDVRLPEATTSWVGHKYEIEIMNRADLPQWAADDEIHFRIEPGRYDGLTVISPYRYKEQGQPFPPPPDPLMQPDSPERPKPQAKVRTPFPSLTPPPLPHQFDQPATYSRDWQSADNEPITGKVLKADPDNLLLQVEREQRTIPIDKLLPQDQARALLWRGISGQDPTLKEARLDYLLTRGDDISYPIHIYLDGPRFRLELPFVKPTRTIICDTESNSFIVYWDEKKSYLGRTADGDLNATPPRGSNVANWEALRDKITSAPLSPHPEWPGRAFTWTTPKRSSNPDSAGEDFQDPAMLFSGIDSPTLLAALKTLLVPPSLRKENDTKTHGYGIFSGERPSYGHSGASSLLGFCQSAHLIPLRLQWTNTFNPNSKYADYRKPDVGTFRLELTNLVLGPCKKELFEIPAEASAVTEDRFRQIPAKK